MFCILYSVFCILYSVCITSRLRFLPEMVPFRSAWYYSNTLVVLASRVCEETTDKSWTEVVEEAFWQPLQMNNTFMTTTAMARRDNLALPYILRMRVDDMFVEQDPRLFEYVVSVYV